MNKTATLLGLILFLSSCVKDVVTNDPVIIDTSKVYSFSSDVYPMFNRLSCTGCHGSSGDLDFSQSPSAVRK